MIYESLNVLGEKLSPCSINPVTGFYRDGCCNTGDEDKGMHTVCIMVDEDFLNFSKEAGNDLSTPRPEFNFSGLKPGNRWCLCAPRWLDAKKAGMAPKVVLEATHEETLAIINLDSLKEHSI